MRSTLPGSTHETAVRTAPVGGVTVDVPFVLGSEFLIPSATTAAGLPVVCVKGGLVALPIKSGETWATSGLPVYWHPTNFCEDTDSATNRLIGTYDRAYSATHAVVCLNGVSAPAVDGDLSAKANLLDLASVANAKGASLIGIEDTGSAYTGTNLEVVMAEVAISLLAKLPKAGGTMTGAIVPVRASGACTSNAATLNGQSGIVTTEALTTAAGASETITITNSYVTPTTPVVASVCGGTNTKNVYVPGATSGDGSFTVAIVSMETAL
jgi:predicted RecA/RadA family phage recombinase